MTRSCPPRPRPNTRLTSDSPARPGAAAVAERLEDRRLFAAFDVLVFSRTAGFRHQSIDEGIDAIEDLGAANDFAVTATEDAATISDANLAQYEAVVFLSTTGDFLNETQQAAFERYIEAGGGFVGVHGAADAEYDWAWYGGLLGAYFDEHPDVQEATINVADDAHPATAGLPAAWERTDEWYNFRTNPRTTAGVNVLLTLDEDSYTGGTMGDDHPIAWFHEYEGGRSFYTGLGHTPSTYAEPLFRQHLLGGIRYAAGATEATRPPTAAASADRTTGPAPLAVAFTSTGTDPGERGPVTYAWDFDNDGTVDSTSADATFTYAQAGSYTARLVVTDADARTSEDTVAITAIASEPPPPPPNPAPVAVPDAATTPRGEAVVVNVLANDTDDDTLDPASVAFVTQPAHGTVSLNPATGAVTYTPAAGYAGADAFSYTVRDAEGATSTAATVTLTVTEPPAPPPPPEPEPVLSVALSGALPAAAVGGDRAKVRQSVTVRNLTASPFNDRVTVRLYASADDALDAQDVPLAGAERSLVLRLKPGAEKTVPLRIGAFPALADGSYRVLAQASSAIAGDDNTAASGSAVTVAAPFRDLTATFAATPTGTVRAGGRGSARLLLGNAGNATAAGTVTVTLTAAGPAGDVPLGSTTARVNIRPSATKPLTARFLLPTAAGTYTLRASVAASGDLVETDQNNNAATAAGPFTVG